MDTPIVDFVRQYVEKKMIRAHMPGHKGVSLIGAELYDITEVEGADSLYEANGIIKRSEENAGSIFGCNTFYSVEGSSLCIRAMMYLIASYAHAFKKKTKVYATRNSHKAFLSACALLDIDVEWLYSKKDNSYLSISFSPEELDKRLSEADEKPIAVYVTSPDYLGGVADISGLASACHKHGVFLVVDNAHGAYLKFLPSSIHPMDLGADLCCDSAHKTLPVITGGAYLHISHNAPNVFLEQAKGALSMFGSTSPSYLILQSLDAVNNYICNGYKARLSDFILKVDGCKKMLILHGYELFGDEPLKITVKSKPYGYDGREFSKLLGEKDISVEFSDPDFVVMMLTPETDISGLKKITDVLLSVPQRKAVTDTLTSFCRPEKVMSVREASMCPYEDVCVENSVGRILAGAEVACPPAVPIVVCGERIDGCAIEVFKYYGIEKCSVIKGIE